MKIANIVTVFTALLTSVVPMRARSSVVQSLVAGNTSFSQVYCDAEDSLSHFFKFLFHGNLGTAAPAYQGFVNGIEITSSSNFFNDVETATIPQGTQCSASAITVSSQNVAITTTAPALGQGDYVEVANCLNTPQGEACQGDDYIFYFVNPASPDLEFTSPVAQINTTGTTNVPVALFDGSHGFSTGMGYAFQTVNASCTTQYGALVSVSPSSATTDATGHVPNPFVITTTRLQVPVAGGQPSATCNFSPANYPSRLLSVHAIGQSVQPSLSISPTRITTTGTKLVTATINYQYPGLQINASCANNGSNVTVTPASNTTNSSGSTSFYVSASKLVGYGSVPTPSCTFQVNGGTGSASLSFATGDACTFGLEPQPPQCGNP
jgi:hypothetical protein